jgi:hypothetical protein
VPLRVGDTFFLSNTGGAANPAGAHLMICLAVDPKKDTAIIVPLITRHEYSDTSCVLNVGDHAFITHETCAAYDFARVVTLSETSNRVDRGAIKLKAPVSADVLKRLQVGFVLSDETAPWVFEAGNGAALTKWLKHQGLID